MATLGALRDDLFELVSKNTELDPATATGAAILDRYLKRAFEYVCSIRLPRGGSLDGLLGIYEHVFVQLDPLIGLASGGSTNSIMLDLSVSEPANAFNGWIVRIEDGLGAGQERVITSYNDTTRTATVFPEWDTVPDTTSEYLITTRKVFIGASPTRFVLGLNDPTRLRNIVRVVLVSSEERKLELSSLSLIDEASRSDFGEPTSFVFKPGVILLDRAPSEQARLDVLCQLIPAFPTSIADEVYLPTPFEQLVILHARWWILVRYGELQDAYAAKKDFFDMLGSLSIPGEDMASWERAGTWRVR